MNSDEQTKIAYADCFSGVSGDMFLGALIDAGLPLGHLQSKLSRLDLEKFMLCSSRKQDQSIGSTRLVIESEKSETARAWKDIRQLILQSDLDKSIKEKSLQIFTCLAEAESRIHDCKMDEVHFHEIGGLDSIIDIVGAVIGLDYFGIYRLVTSPLPMPRGFVRCEHGTLPLPSPAVCEILQDVPVYGTSI